MATGPCAPSPAALFERVRRNGAAGTLLLESAPVGAPHGRRSLILVDPLVRLTARENRARFEALQPRGERLLDDLQARLPQSKRRGPTTLELQVSPSIGSPGQPDRERLLTPSVLDLVRAMVCAVEDVESTRGELGALPIAVYGAFSYELVDHFEDLPARPSSAANGEPDLHLVLGLDGIEIDHARGRTTITCRAFEGNDSAREEHEGAQRLADLEELVTAPSIDAAFSSNRTTGRSSRFNSSPENVPSHPSTASFVQRVRRLLAHIDAGDVFQTVLSRSFQLASEAEPLDVYRTLCARNPSPYQFFLDLDEGSLFGASPECCVRVQGSEVELRPIAGTVPRGFGADGVTIDADLDARRAASLLLDPKEQAEHAMLVDLARNDLARIALAGTRRVDKPFHVESYSHVHHLVSRVTATLDPRFDALDAYRACANMGTLSGAPKVRATELIRELEDEERGFYGGAVGFLTRDGELDTCIVIRSLRHRDGTYTARAGAGIVADSLPEREAQETRHKAAAPLAAVLSTRARAALSNDGSSTS